MKSRAAGADWPPFFLAACQVARNAVSCGQGSWEGTIRDFIARRISGPVFAGLAVVLAIAVVHFLNIASLDRLGLIVFDSYQKVAPRQYEDAAVRIVDIDEESVERLGQWPWPRTEIARLTDRLSQAGAAAIAFDIVFAEPDRTSPDRLAGQLQETAPALAGALAQLPSNDDALADSFAVAPVVNGLFLLSEQRGEPLELASGMAMLGSEPARMVTDFQGSVQPLSVLRDAAPGLGSLTIEKDADGIVRKAPLVFMHRGELVPSLSVEALRIAQGADATLVTTSDGSGETAGSPGAVVSVRTGEFEAPTNAAGELLLHFTGPAPERIVPAWRILAEDVIAEELSLEVAGQIVFVGASATGLRDLVSTPLNEGEPGVTVHAQAAEQIILGTYLTRPDWARGVELVLILALGVGLALILPKVDAVPGAVVGLAGIAAIVAGSWFAFDQARYLLDPTYPVLTIITVYGVQTLYGFYREEQQRAYIHNAFDRYLSPEMVRQIANNPGKLELGGEEREMTVLFCDIRGFSRISEQYEPHEVIEFLTAFLTPMCDILIANKGTVDKFIGDAILAFWNAPLDDPEQFRNGANAALEMLSALEALNRTMPVKAGQVWPRDVQIGIGMNAGLCCVGNMGSQQRLSYSLIGDTVNIASRYEGLTKQYGVGIVIGSALAEKLAKEQEAFAMLELDRVRVVGREEPDTIYALLGDSSMATNDEFAALKLAHSQFLTLYRTQDWQTARKHLSRHQQTYDKAGLAALCATYHAHMEQLQTANLSPAWDGVFQATSK